MKKKAGIWLDRKKTHIGIKMKFCTAITCMDGRIQDLTQMLATRRRKIINYKKSCNNEVRRYNVLQT